MAACDVRASVWYMVGIPTPEGTKSKVIWTADSHRVALLAVGNERIVIDLQDNIRNTVNVGETEATAASWSTKLTLPMEGKCLEVSGEGSTKVSHHEWDRAR